MGFARNPSDGRAFWRGAWVYELRGAGSRRGRNRHLPSAGTHSPRLCAAATSFRRPSGDGDGRGRTNLGLPDTETPVGGITPSRDWSWKRGSRQSVSPTPAVA